MASCEWLGRTRRPPVAPPPSGRSATPSARAPRGPGRNLRLSCCQALSLSLLILRLNHKGIRPAQCRATAGSADAATNWPSALGQMSAAAPPAPASSWPRHPRASSSWAPPPPAASRSPGTKRLRMSVRVCVRGCSTERDRHATWHGTVWHSMAATCDVRCCAGRVRDRYVLWRAPGYQGAALSRRRCGR